MTDTKAESIFQAGVRSAERLFESIANYSYDWESWIDPGGKPRWINPAVLRMTGYTVEECLRMVDYPLPLIDRDDRSEIRRHLRAAARKTSGNDIAFRIQHRDGTLRWAAVSYQSLYDDEGRWLGYRTSVRDFTERKRSEEAIRAAHEEAARANRAKGQFLAAASHDLRQPLQAANLFLAALKSQGLDAHQQETAANIDMALRATNDLLDSLLDMSRLDAGVLQPQFRDFRLQPVVEKLVGEFVEEATQRRLALRVAAIPHSVRSDPQLIERLLRNLVANALRYTERGGVLIGARRRGKRVLLGVWDTGIGIAPEDRQRIFEEFVQLGNIERDRRRGLGLGLAIVDRIGRLLDHPVTLRSHIGRGSAFEISLPVADDWDMPALPASVPPPAGALAGRHVLAIEDDPMQREALSQLFRKWGCDIETVRSAVEGLQFLADTGLRPDVIVADYRLRDGRNGADAIRVLRQFCGRAVPGIIVTGDTEPTRLAEAKASGFTLLHKPVDPDRLRATVEDALD